MRKVIVVQKAILNYRVPFLNELNDVLRVRGVELVTVAGTAPANLGLQDALGEVKGGVRVPSTFFKGCFWLGGLSDHIYDSELVILLQNNSFLNIYPILFRHAWGKGPKVAFWGHGLNLNTTQKMPLRNLLKRYLSMHVDWWFAFTSMSKEILVSQGYDPSRITDVQNAVDTDEIRTAMTSRCKDEALALADRLFQGDRLDRIKVGVFCARLVPLKWVPFLIRSITIVHQKLPEFRMLIIGDGPQKELVDEFCQEQSWCVSLGAQYGSEKCKYLQLADVWLNPGGTGLMLLEAFALGIPFLTTDCGLHGPEIAYLELGRNGIMTDPSELAFAEGIIHLLRDDKLLKRMSQNAYESSQNYSISNMVENFSDGIFRCLGLEEGMEV